MPHDWLEQRVIDEVLRFYTERYLLDGGMLATLRVERERIARRAEDSSG